MHATMVRDSPKARHTGMFVRLSPCTACLYCYISPTPLFSLPLPGATTQGVAWSTFLCAVHHRQHAKASPHVATTSPHVSFRAMCTACPSQVLPKELRGQLSGALFDLGISSPQLDDPARGMRPEQSGPLDLRFDISTGGSGQGQG